MKFLVKEDEIIFSFDYIKPVNKYVEEGYMESDVDFENAVKYKQVASYYIGELKQKLSNTDYQAIKFAEGILTEYEYMPIKMQRQSWRDEINELEKKL